MFKNKFGLLLFILSLVLCELNLKLITTLTTVTSHRWPECQRYLQVQGVQLSLRQLCCQSVSV